MTARLNYCSQALETMAVIGNTVSGIGKYSMDRDPQFTLDIAKSARDTILLMNQAVKFILPEWGRVFNEDEWKLVENQRFPSRLPYPVIAVEFPCTYNMGYSEVIKNREVPSSKRIALAAEYEAIIALCPDLLGPIVEGNPHPQKEGFYVFPVCYADPAEVWTPPPSAMFMPRVGMIGDEELMQARMGTICVLPLGRESYTYYPEEERQSRAARDVADEALAITHLMIALSLDKGRHETLPAPEKLNRKRVKKGKVPLFEYKVLDIVADVLHQPKESTHERSSSHHASPRMHNRRGHLRRLASGQTTWVRNAIIGKPSRGRVIKDYAVHD